ncbi:tandem-95 repeat protein, partial [Desulfobacterales bacterium HSG2]|nr:tandem-95 repeat protein [Desulfobacterales bacterium HSG2]
YSDSGPGSYTTADDEFPALSGPANLTLGSAGGVTLHADRTLTGSLTLISGGFSADGYSLDIGGDVMISGGAYISAAGNLTVGGNWTKTGGTFDAGTGTVFFNRAAAQSLQSGGGTFNNLTVDKTGGTVSLSDDLDADETLAIAAGTLDAAGQNISVAGDWDNDGTFTAGAGTVTLDGDDQTIRGSTTFSNLTKDVTLSATLTFENSTAQTITDTLTLQGADADSRLSLRSDSDGVQWQLDPQGTRNLAWLDVRDSNNVNAAKADTTQDDCVSSGNNTGWNVQISVAETQTVPGVEDNRSVITLVGRDADDEPILTFHITSLPVRGTLWQTDNGSTGSAEITAPGTQVTHPGHRVVYYPAENDNGNGIGNFGFKVNDTEYDSPSATVTVNVAAVNDAPVIIGQQPVPVPEDLPLTVAFSHLTVTDVDNSYPTDFTLTVYGGTNYASEEENPATILPSPDFNGTLSVPVRVNDGAATSGYHYLSVTVNPVDDAPSVANEMADVTTDEDAAPTVTDLGGVFGDVDSDISAITKTVLLNSNPSLVTVDIAGNTLTLTYLPNQHGEAAITVRGTSDGKTADETFTVTVASVNDVPTAGDVSKSGTEGTTLFFTGSDFSDAFSDADGDILNRIRFTTLPADGILRVNGVAVALNDEITAADLAAFIFEPAPGWYGETLFTWEGSDGNAWSDTSANMSIAVAAIPVMLEPIFKTGPEDQDIMFDAGDLEGFEYGYDSKVKVVSLPENGVLLFDSSEAGPDHEFAGTPITEGQEMMLMSELLAGELRFRPDPEFSGSVNFLWRISKAAVWSEDNGVTITIMPVNDLPILTDISRTGDEDIGVRFAGSDFSDAFSDIDGDILNRIRITALPGHGTLSVNGTAAALNDEIPAADLGGFVFEPDENYNGTDSFSWNGHDGTGYAETAAAVTLTVSPADDEPVISEIEDQTTDRNSPTDLISFTVSDPDIPADSLAVSAVSSNTDLVPDGNVVLTGSGKDRMMIITPAPDTHGTTGVTLTVTDGILTAEESFTLTVLKVYKISGQVTYFAGENPPVPDVLVTLESDDGTFSAEALTDEAGNYIFSGIPPGGHYVSVFSKEADPGTGTISAGDASKIARYVVGDLEFDELQREAADVNQNGRVSSVDASDLSRYRVGLIPEMNEAGISWIFTPASLPYPDLSSDMENQDVAAMVLGDISGNYSPFSAADLRGFENLGGLRQNLGGLSSLSVPVVLNGGTEIEGIDINIGYDEKMLEVADVTLADGMFEDEDYRLIANPVDGQIRIALFALTGNLFTGDGPVLFISFDVVGTRPGTVLEFTEFQCNETPVSDGHDKTRDSGLSGGFYIGGAVSQRLILGTEYDLITDDPDGDGVIGVGDAIQALEQGDLEGAIRALRCIVGN